MTALRVLAAALYGFGLSFLAVSQTVQPTALKPQSSNSPALHPTFDAASVKRLPPGAPRPPNDRSHRNGRDHGRCTYRGFPLRALLATAYDLPFERVLGPGWIESEQYDIQAVIPPETPDDQIMLMLQNLLTERFQLKVRLENRPTAVYALLVAKGGPKLKPAEKRKEPKGLPAINEPHGRMCPTPSGCEFLHSTMGMVATLLSLRVDRPVVDMTGLSGTYDLTLDWSADKPIPAIIDPSADAAADHPRIGLGMSVDAPTILSSLKAVGLRAEQRKAPLKFLIVDRAERMPIGN
jgi:uncharacterized protein (TIGR03435 family)